MHDFRTVYPGDDASLYGAMPICMHSSDTETANCFLPASTYPTQRALTSRCGTAPGANGDGTSMRDLPGRGGRWQATLLSFMSSGSITGCERPAHSRCVWTAAAASLHPTSTAITTSARPRGNQVAYVVFPRSDLCRARAAMYNTPFSLAVEPGNLLRVDISEFGNRALAHDSVACISYYLDQSLRIQEVRLSDDFRQARDYLVAQGVLAPVSRRDYEEALRLAVTYWTTRGGAERQLRGLARVPVNSSPK